ncbi:MAG: lysophospholipase [Myxococcota bacterium]
MRDQIVRKETQVVLSDRGERYARSWLPPSPSRVMILIHGYAEHAGRYDEMAMYFAERGFAVHAYDQAGHGRTAGPRGHVDRFDRLPEEVARFAALVGQRHPGLPITLVGHSMGGLVVAATCVDHAPPVDRVVLSGALLELGGGGLRQTLSLWVARVLSVVAPKVGFSAGLDPQGISRDPEVVRRYVADPYVKDRMSARFAAGMNAAVARARAGASRVERPMLVLHGGLDRMTSPAGSHAFHAGLAGPVAAHSALKIYPDLRHEIFNEPEREAVWQDVLDWLDT